MPDGIAELTHLRVPGIIDWKIGKGGKGGKPGGRTSIAENITLFSNAPNGSSNGPSLEEVFKNKLFSNAQLLKNVFN